MNKVEKIRYRPRANARDQINSYDWTKKHVDIILDEHYEIQPDFLFDIYDKSKMFPDCKIFLHVSAGPFLQIFKDCPNVQWKYVWKNSAINEFNKTVHHKDFLKQIATDKNVEHTISTFNGSFHWSRLLFTLSVFNSGLWNDNFCTKSQHLVTNIKYLKSWQDKGLDKLVTNITKKDLQKFIQSHNGIDYTKENALNYVHNFKIQSPIMNRTLVNVVCETAAEFDLPFITEKVFFSVVNKTIALTLGQQHWYKVFNQCYGFENFDCFDYSFDNEKDMITRIEMVVNQLLEISSLTKQEQTKIHQRNKDVLEYNYEHFLSGRWMQHCESSTRDLDKIISLSYNKRKDKKYGQTV